MYYIDQGIIDVATCVATGAPSIGWMTLIQEYFDTYQRYFYLRSIKNISKHFFHLIRSSTKIVEFDNVKFPKILSTKDGVWREFLETDSNSMFSRKWVPQKREFSYPFYRSINCNNTVVTIHIYVFPNSGNRGFTSLIILRVYKEGVLPYY